VTTAHEPWADEVARTGILVSHYPLWLDALGSVLLALQIDVIGQTALPARALELLHQHEADVLVVDLDAPTGESGGVDLVGAALALRSELKVIGIGRRDDTDTIDAVLGAGAAAYVVKTASAEELRSAVRQAFSESIYLPSGVPAAEPRPAHPASAAGEEVDILTRREIEILRLAAEGHSNTELARRLWVTEQTVKFHLSNIYRKLDVANRTEAARWAAAHGLLSSMPERGG
jgi:DNA-binding NarL/FixJ family response regulator